MSRALVFTADAEADVLDGFRSYEDKHAGLGVRYLEEIERILNLISLNPYLYQEVELEVRRAVLHTFPYLLFYTIDADAIFVLAVLHGAQNPEYIKSRLVSKR